MANERNSGLMLRFALIAALFISSPCRAQTRTSLGATATQTAPESSPIAVIPFELVRDHIFIEATVEHSRPLSMFIDSGEPFSVIDDEIAKELDLVSQQTAPYQGFGTDKRPPAKITKGHELRLGPLLLENMVFWIMPTRDFSRFSGRPVDGVLGADLFERYVVEIDYAARELRIFEPDSYTLPHTPYVLPVTLVGEWMVPLLQSKVTAPGGGVVNASLVFDTGASMSVFSKSFSDAHPSLVSSGKTLAGPKGSGANGSTSYLVGRVKEMELGDLRIREPVVLFSLDSAGLASRSDYDGSIGEETLEAFTVVVDYKGRNIALEPTGEFGRRVEYDMSGMHLLSDETDFHRFEVDFVAVGAEAAKKGILAGDVVISANGKAASTLTLDEIDRMLARPGKIKLRMMRNGKQFRATLKLVPRI